MLDQRNKYDYISYMRYSWIIILILAASTSVFADNLIAKIKTKYDNIKTIQGNFTQNTCSEFTGTCQQFEGKFSIARPYYSRLEVTVPEKQLLVTDSLYSYIYLVKQKKLYVQTANSGISFFKIFDMFLNNTTKFIRTDQDSLYTILTYKKDSLEPITMFNDLALHINNQTRLIEQFAFTDMSGNEMKFELTNLKINPKLSRKLFTVEIPKGTEVIKY